MTSYHGVKASTSTGAFDVGFSRVSMLASVTVSMLNFLSSLLELLSKSSCMLVREEEEKTAVGTKADATVPVLAKAMAAVAAIKARGRDLRFFFKSMEDVMTVN